MHGELRRDDVVLGVRVAVDGRLELLHEGVGQDLVGELVVHAHREARHAFVGELFLGAVENQVAAQVEAVDDVEHAEEQRLTPGDLLVADADVERAFLVVEEQGREVDEVVRAGRFQRIRALQARNLVLEVVGIAAVQGRIAATDAAGVAVGRGSADRTRCSCPDRTRLADGRPASGSA